MKIIKDKTISGLSLLEALVSTAIVGIGFVAILQMTIIQFNLFIPLEKGLKLII